jgi:hypothetical protein
MNIWAVLFAAVSSFLLGGLWYSPALFGRAWNTANNGPKHNGHPAKVFGVSFVFSLIAAICFALWVGAAPPIEASLKSGALAGFGFVATSFGINYQFAQHPFVLWLIDSGYHTVQFLLFGLIIGLWH